MFLNRADILDFHFIYIVALEIWPALGYRQKSHKLYLFSLGKKKGGQM